MVEFGRRRVAWLAEMFRTSPRAALVTLAGLLAGIFVFASKSRPPRRPPVQSEIELILKTRRLSAFSGRIACAIAASVLAFLGSTGSPVLAESAAPNHGWSVSSRRVGAPVKLTVPAQFGLSGAVISWLAGTYESPPTPTTPLHFVATKPGVNAAGNDASSAVSGRNLGRQLASEQQVGEAGLPIAGRGTNTVLRDSPRLAAKYGGQPGEWAKMSSSSYTGADGRVFETHWYENGVTGQRVEFKTKFPDGSNLGSK